MLREPDLRERLAVEAVEPMPMTPEQFGQYIRADIAALERARQGARTSISTNERVRGGTRPMTPEVD